MCCLFWKHVAMLHCHSKMCGLLFAGWCIISHAEDVVTKLDTKIMTAETEFNSSLNTYNTFANATETLANNVSKFQALIQERYDKNLPFMLFFLCCVWRLAPHGEVLVFLKKVGMFWYRWTQKWWSLRWCALLFHAFRIGKTCSGSRVFFGRCEGLLSVSIGLKLILVWSEMTQYVYVYIYIYI